MVFQEPYNENISVSGAVSNAGCALRRARKKISYCGTESGGKERHFERLLSAVTTSCAQHGFIARIAPERSIQFLHEWRTDLAAVVCRFGALPDLVQAGVKEMAYFYRQVFDKLADQDGAEHLIFELMASQERPWLAEAKQLG